MQEVTAAKRDLWFKNVNKGHSCDCWVYMKAKQQSSAVAQ